MTTTTAMAGFWLPLTRFWLDDISGEFTNQRARSYKEYFQYKFKLHPFYAIWLNVYFSTVQNA